MKDPHIIDGPVLRRSVPACTLPVFLRERAREVPENVALVEAASGRSYSYAQLDHAIGRFAAGLAKIGFRPGDVLLMFAPNMPEWVIAALGALTAGGVLSGANPTYTASELAHQLRDVDARYVFTSVPCLPIAREAAALAGCKHIILFGEAEDTYSFASLLANDDPEPAVESDPDAVAMLPYSSGTTGLSKGVMLSHRALVTHTVQLLQANDDPGHNVVLTLLPMFHASGFTVVTLLGLASGWKLVTVARFDPNELLSTISSQRVTWVGAVPPIMLFFATHPLVDAYDLSSVRFVACGAAPLSADTERKVAERLRCRVAQAYGMTEACCVLTYSPSRTRLGSSGSVFPGTQARVVDLESGASLPRGQSGELQFCGPQLFAGYLHRPDATAQTMSEDGWLRTGDIGYIDADGFVFITDRIKELIKVKGFQVPPAELEALLLAHPNVADAAVIGRPDARSGEVPVAYLVPRGQLDSDSLCAWLATQVVEYKQLHDVILCAVIPKNASGKILRRVLRGLDTEKTRAVDSAGPRP